jgi:hypothetical protein
MDANKRTDMDVYDDDVNMIGFMPQANGNYARIGLFYMCDMIMQMQFYLCDTYENLFIRVIFMNNFHVGFSSTHEI